MKPVLLAFALFGQFSPSYDPPKVPASKPNPDYPLHVRILESRWGRDRMAYHGFGRGNIIVPGPHLGFDYVDSCDPFLHNAQRGEFYQARWKKENAEIELLTLKVGSDHESKCTLKVSLKQEPYGMPAAAAPILPGPLTPPAAVPQ